MNCKFCESHILDATQIMWRGDSYHAGCIGEAVAEKRTAGEQKIVAQENHEKQRPAGDNLGNFAEIKDCVIKEHEKKLIEEHTIVSDDLLAQMPPLGGNGGVIIPHLMKPLRSEIHIKDLTNLVEGEHLFKPSRKTESNGNRGDENKSIGTLISGNTTALIDRNALKHLPMPEATETHQPVNHHALVEQIYECLSYRHLSVVREEYAVSSDGMKCFGLLELNVEYAGVRFAIGLRNSNDKSMRIGLVAGYRVTVCENKMLTGDFNPLSAKHSKNFNLIDAVSVAVDRIQRNIGRVERHISLKKQQMLSDESAKSIIYEAFMNRKIPMSLMRSVHKEFFVQPEYRAFADKSLWSLENCFTNAFKKLKPVQQFEACSKLGKLITPLVFN